MAAGAAALPRAARRVGRGGGAADRARLVAGDRDRRRRRARRPCRSSARDNAILFLAPRRGDARGGARAAWSWARSPPRCRRRGPGCRGHRRFAASRRKSSRRSGGGLAARTAAIMSCSCTRPGSDRARHLHPSPPLEARNEQPDRRLPRPRRRGAGCAPFGRCRDPRRSTMPSASAAKRRRRGSGRSNGAPSRRRSGCSTLTGMRACSCCATAAAEPSMSRAPAAPAATSIAAGRGALRSRDQRARTSIGSPGRSRRQLRVRPLEMRMLGHKRRHPPVAAGRAVGQRGASRAGSSSGPIT